MGRIVLVGDVGGFPGELARVVGGGGHDLVIQVGDLVDRGPDSPGVLALVRERLERDRRGWVQLIGNHEWQYLDGEIFWPEPLGEDDQGLLRAWWLREWVRVAAAVRAADGEEFLITHAGLGVEAWRQLGEPVTATTAADLLNTRPREVLGSYRGPLWASAGSEVYESWLDEGTPMPFSQIHGHDQIVGFEGRTWRCGERVRQRAIVDWAARHTITRVSGGARFIGIDPRHGRTGAPQWAPLVLDGATLVA
ncbi:metallophosphoesterase [Paractinoplanes globisporus]|uniref:Metallophosphoesterase n=1 Tax=Paractinoplanes globisporus TaxID=113565 RepID=A0ABW6WVQ6_9ACTN|nr:metallophosphoesterase [Actinoplanes globisporus]